MTFSPELYEQIRAGAQRSAETVVPYVIDLSRPATVVDVGGGEGWWGRAFFEAGCDVLVADESVDAWRFEARAGGPRIDFGHLDLDRQGWSSAVAEERAEIARIHGGSPSVDLAVCLEVAEHLAAEYAGDLVAGLCELAPVVLFSAAIPGQGGHGHLNEQWPAYWADLFYGFGYLCTEDLRAEYWDYDEIEPWYRQNLLLFARVDWFDDRGMSFTKHPRALVHPDIYGWRLAERDELAAKLAGAQG